MDTLGGAAQRGTLAQMNVVPLIDILLVLLIIFLVISPSHSNGLPVAVPQPATDVDVAALPPAAPIVVQLDDAGGLRINEEAASWDSLGPRLKEIFTRRGDKTAFVTGGDTVLFAQVARAIDITRGSGVDRIGLLTAKLQARR